MTCRRKPYGFNTRKVKKSPFRTTRRAQNALRSYRTGKSIGFTARSSLKSMGIVPRANGCFLLGNKYR